MAKIAAITISRLSLSKIPKNKIIFIINFVLFISLFAVTASITALYYERNIDRLEKEIATDYTNEIIYNYWLSNSPRNIRNIDNIINKNFSTENYTIYIKTFNDKLITNRTLGHNPAIDYIRFGKINLKNLEYALQDAVIVSSSTRQIDQIIKYNKIKDKIEKKFFSLRTKELFYIESADVFETLSEDELEKQHLYYLENKQNFIEILEEIKKIYIDFCIVFFSKSKKDSENKINKAKKEIQDLAAKESKTILFAFIIQILIFLLLQYFEFGFESSVKKIRKKLLK